METTDRPQRPAECKHYEDRRCIAHNRTMCINELFSVRNGYQKPHCPDFTPKEKKDGNNCANLYKNSLCWLTAHHHERKLIAYPCAYLSHDCSKCKDYRAKDIPSSTSHN